MLKFKILLCLSATMIASGEHQYDDKASNEIAGGEKTRDVYHWGYYVNPKRFHTETKDRDGRVDGQVSFVDANGHRVEWDYRTSPTGGFKVNNYNTAPEGSRQFKDDVGIPNFYRQNIETNPLLKSAINQRKIVPAGYHGNHFRFAIAPEVVESSVGISALARDLDAIPVAAVHDGHGAPMSMNARDQTSPLLLQHEEVPTQLGRNFFILV